LIKLQSPLQKNTLIEELEANLSYFDEATTYTVIPTGSSHDLSVTFHARGEEGFAKETRKIKNINGIDQTIIVRLEQTEVPKMWLDDTDWRVIRVLKRNVRRNPKDLSDELGMRQGETEGD